MPGAISIPPGPAAARSGYAEHPPPPALAPYVECFWSRGPARLRHGAAPSHRVIPDGCVDIMLAFGPPSGAGAALDVALAVGAMTRPLVFRDAPAATYLGVRFRPGAAGMLFGLPASELTDERVPQSVALAEVWADGDALRDALARAPDLSARIRTTSAAIARRLLAAGDTPPAAVIAAAERIVATHGKVPIAALAAELGVTRQHLARSFARHVGLSPKLLARVVRARHVVQRLRRGGDVDWSGLALEAGYYDQSHLIGELKELTGLSPSGWAAT